MLKKYLPVFLFLLILLFSVPVSALDEDSGEAEDGRPNIARLVEATGQAAITDNDIGRARERATHDALRTAIERILGVMIKSQTIVKNSRVLKDEIYANSEGFALCNEILDEGRKDGIYTIRLKALVSLVPLRKKRVSM
ncbi:MAG: flagellar assembly protein T N-terminal domain-containing protein, partial [bacterium]